MKNYSFSPYESHNWQIISKYCLELDKQIMSVQNYIDFANPNKIILNYASDAKDYVFYTTEQLIELNILRSEPYEEFEDDEEVQESWEELSVDEIIIINNNFYKITSIQEGSVTYQLIADPGPNITGLNVNRLYPGQIVYNSFGKNLNIFLKNTDLTPVQTITQGIALFKILNEQKDYQIISLDSTGDFYVFSNVNEKGQVSFELLPHGTVEYGLNYLFSLVAQNARWCYWGRDAAVSHLTIIAPNNWKETKLVSWEWSQDASNPSRIPYIATKFQTLWSVNSVLSNEIMSINNNIYEDVCCDTSIERGSQGIDKGSQSNYTINTNMNNNVANGLNFRILLY